MKKIHLLLIAALGALSVISCNKEIEESNTDNNQIQKEAIRFKAVADTPTRATLTDDYAENKVFKAAWEPTDVISVDYGNDGYRYANWNADDKYFVGSDLTAKSDLYAYYPDTKDGFYPFGGIREQDGNKYNSYYDLMYSDKFDLKDGDNDIVVPMHRATAIQYFHLTAEDAAEWANLKVKSATLIVTGNNACIASPSVSINNNGAIKPGDVQNSITITFKEGTEPYAKDAQLWFNVLPCTVESMTISVELEDGYTWTKNNSFSGAGYTFKAGKLGYVVGAPVYEHTSKDVKIVFKSGGSDTGDSNVAFTVSSNLNDVFSEGADYVSEITSTNNVYPARTSVGGAKFGSSKAAGAISISLKEAVNTSKLIITSAPYNATEGQSGLLVNGQKVDMSEGKELILSDYEIELGEKVSSITITHSAGSRVFVKAITLVAGEGPAVTKYNVNCEDTVGGTISADLTKAAEGTTVTLSATPNADYEFGSWNVTNASTKETIIVSDNQFIMPASNVTVSATFNQIQNDREAVFGEDWNSIFETSYEGTFSTKANELVLSATVNGVTINVVNGSSTNGYIKTSDFRAYNGYCITFMAPTGYSITRITSTKGGKTFTSGITANVGSLSISDNSISWTGSSESVVLSCSGTVSFATITVEYSEGVTPTPPTPDPTKLSVPTNLSWNATTKTLSWNNSNSANGAWNTDYKYQYRLGTTGQWYDATSATTVVLNSIASTTTVYVRAYAINTTSYANSAETVNCECTVSSGKTVTFNATSDRSTTTKITKDGITLTATTFNNGSYYQAYSGTPLIVESSVGNITKIEITCTASGKSTYGPSKFSGASTGSYSYSDYVGTWTGNAKSVSLSNTAQVRMTEITVTCE